MKNIGKKIKAKCMRKFLKIKARILASKRINVSGTLLSSNRKTNIVVSLTSYASRYETLDICLKSLMQQTLRPNKIILYIYNKKPDNCLPKRVVDLTKYGVEVKFVSEDLKPHKKYYYAMKEFPNSIIITVDDDCMYDKHLIEMLYKKHLEFPRSIVAARTHKIKFDKNKIYKYKKWMWEYYSNKPNIDIMATGVGGVLYPPHLLDLNMLLDRNMIKKYILTDDLWLKTAEVISKVPTVTCKQWVDNRRYVLRSSQSSMLTKKNIDENVNDININSLNKQYSLIERIYEYKNSIKMEGRNDTSNYKTKRILS